MHFFACNLKFILQIVRRQQIFMASIEQLLVDRGQRRFGQMGINELEAMFSKNRVLMRSQFQQDIFKEI